MRWKETDRSEVIYKVAQALLSDKHVGLATVLLERFGLAHSPIEGAMENFLEKNRNLFDSLRPPGLKTPACETSPDGFCHNDGDGVNCKHCSYPFQQW